AVQVDGLDDSALVAKRGPRPMPTQDVLLEPHQPIGACLGAELVEPGPTGEKDAVVEIAAADRGVHEAHGVTATPPVLRRVGQPRVVLTADPLPGEVEEELTSFCAYAHGGWG